jgi:hypothetical protein
MCNNLEPKSYYKIEANIDYLPNLNLFPILFMNLTLYMYKAHMQLKDAWVQMHFMHIIYAVLTIPCVGSRIRYFVL